MLNFLTHYDTLEKSFKVKIKYGSLVSSVLKIPAGF